MGWNMLKHRYGPKCKECFYLAQVWSAGKILTLANEIYTVKYIIHIWIFILGYWQISETFAALLHCANVRTHKQTGLCTFTLCLRNTTHISMSCESKLNLRHFLWPAVYLPILTDCRGEIGVTLMDRDKSKLFCWERSTSPTVPCSKWLWRNWWETVAGEELCKLLSSPSTHAVPVLELEKRRDYFFPADFLRGVMTDRLSAGWMETQWEQ